MNRALSSVLAVVACLACFGIHAAEPYEVPPENAVFLGRVLAVAKHNDLSDIAFSKQAFGPDIIADDNGRKDLHDSSTLDLIGAGRKFFANFTYYYALKPMKSPLAFWKKDDPLFVGELGFQGIEQFHCISGLDLSTVFRADPDVGLVNSGGRVFHVAQGPNMVTEIVVDGPVESDQPGCVKGLTIRGHRFSRYVPSAGLQ